MTLLSIFLLDAQTVTQKKNLKILKIKNLKQLFVNLKGVLLFLADFLYVFIYVRSSQRLHDSLLDSILHCGMRFFESTPVGRILNRFSTDLEIIETRIPESFKHSLRNAFTVFSVIVVISISTPWFLACLPPIFFFYFFIQV
jgi:ABC-type multidrug transport system fused ATPase/permease subunit